MVLQQGLLNPLLVFQREREREKEIEREGESRESKQERERERKKGREKGKRVRETPPVSDKACGQRGQGKSTGGLPPSLLIYFG